MQAKRKLGGKLTISLVKHERDVLRKAAELLADIGRITDEPDLSAGARESSTAIANILTEIDAPEPELVG